MCDRPAAPSSWFEMVGFALEDREEDVMSEVLKVCPQSELETCVEGT